MNSLSNQSEPSETKFNATQKRDVKRFVYVMVIFTIGMALLLFFEVGAWYIWYIYFAVWTLIEYRIAKNIKLKWWHWILIITAIVLVDILVLEFVEFIKN